MIPTQSKEKNAKMKLLLGPRAVAHHSSVVNGDDMYLIGGSNTRTENKGFFKLDMKTMSWELIEQL
jgi:hypothetical protein